MSLVLPQYRALVDDTDSIRDPLALALMSQVEAQNAVTWDLIPFGENVTSLKFEVGDRLISARQVVLENNFLVSDSDIDINSATRDRITDGHILYHPATKQRIVLNEVNTTSGVCTFHSVLQAPGGSRTQVNAGQTLYVLAQSEMYEEINATSRWEETDKITNYVQDTTELLKYSRADLRETRKWGLDKQTMQNERMRDVMKDLNLGLLYNVPQAPSSSVPAVTSGIDYMIENAGNVVDAASSGTASMADVRGVLKSLEQNGVGPSEGLFALMSVNTFHAYEDVGLTEINIEGQPGAEYVLGNTITGVKVSGVGFVPFYVDPFINDDRVRFISQKHVFKRFYQGPAGPVESPHLEDEPSLSTSKTPVSSLQMKWATDIRNASSAHYILDNTGLN